LILFGGAEGDRTPDLMTAREVKTNLQPIGKRTFIDIAANLGINNIRSIFLDAFKFQLERMDEMERMLENLRREHGIEN